jgi:hypothetical protein
MGDLNQLDFVLENRGCVKGPVLEIGSRDYGNTNDFRPYFPTLSYLGVDMEPGQGVDLVCDFVDPLETIEARLRGARFRTVI